MSVSATNPAQGTYTISTQTNLDTLDQSLLTDSDKQLLKTIKESYAALVLSIASKPNDGSWAGYDWRQNDRHG